MGIAIPLQSETCNLANERRRSIYSEFRLFVFNAMHGKLALLVRF